MQHEALHRAIERHFKADALFGKGGFWVKGHGFVTLAKARRITGVVGVKRQPREYIAPYGDWAMVGAINHIKPTLPRA